MAQMQRGKLPGGPGSAPPARAASSRPSRQPATASHEPGPGALRLWLRRLGTALGGLVFAAVLGLAWWINTPLGLKDGHVELRFEPGTSPRAVAQALVDAGVDTSPRLLFEWFRWSGEGRRIRAGTYALDAGTTPRELLRKLVDGEQVLAKVRFIEGWTFRQLRAELAKAPGLKPESQAMSEAELMTAIGQPGVSPEGRFFPDTYTYAPGSADLQVLKRAFVAMQLRLEATWTQREPDSPLAAPDDLLKLASIVEKESAMAADRGKIAAVFHNRLKIGMPLQTDPTVIYGLGEKFDGNLRKADLQRDTPFNTYLRPGLPPTPIALPGAESLAAAIRPAQSKALYFVARGDGSSEFSETLDQHNRAVSRFQRGGQ
ncbi:MAG: endolytic transglycosylase MltG [Pseudomonadota bacterium]|jgi:UPF0755 protein